MTPMLKKIFLLSSFSLVLLLPGACSEEPADAADADVSGQGQQQGTALGSVPAGKEPANVIARVGDQTITFDEINTMINSAAIVGLSMPELGSPERDTVRITLLDKMISANLLYLDALQQGVDQDPDYQRDVQQFADAILANLYRSKYLVGEIEVTDQEIEQFYKTNIVAGTEFNDELRTGIEATIRKQRVMERTANMREQLREGHKTAIIVTELDPEDDQVRSDDEIGRAHV